MANTSDSSALSWLCAVSNFKARDAEPRLVIDASAVWLADAPDSPALLRLAEESDARNVRREDVSNLVDQAMSDLGWGPLTRDQYLWLSLVCFLASSSSSEPAATARFLASFALVSPSEFDLLKSFIADVDDLDDDIQTERVLREILSAFFKVRKELLSRAREHLSRSPVGEVIADQISSLEAKTTAG